MKKLTSMILVLSMILGLLAGCSKTQPPSESLADLDAAPTLFYDITGIPHDQIVMTVGEIQVPAELYFYWVCYVCSSLEYNIMSEYSNYGMYGSCIDRETMTVDWTSTYANMPLMEYALAQAEDTIKYYMSIEELAAEMNAGLTAANQVDIENTFRQAVEEMGGGDAFINYLKMLGISRTSFDRISAASYLYMNLLDLTFQEGSKLYLAEEHYNTYATYADHILIATQNMQNGEMLTQQQRVEKLQLATDLVDQIRAAADPIAKFEELANEYSEDPGRESNPTGYIFTPGTMVAEFEEAAAGLMPGEISDPVQSDYGFHIILRRDLVAAIREDEARKVEVAREYLDQQLVRKRSTSEIIYDDVLKTIDWTNFYKTYIAEVDKLNASFSTK